MNEEHERQEIETLCNPGRARLRRRKTLEEARVINLKCFRFRRANRVRKEERRKSHIAVEMYTPEYRFIFSIFPCVVVVRRRLPARCISLGMTVR